MPRRGRGRGCRVDSRRGRGTLRRRPRRGEPRLACPGDERVAARAAARRCRDGRCTARRRGISCPVAAALPSERRPEGRALAPAQPAAPGAPPSVLAWWASRARSASRSRSAWRYRAISCMSVGCIGCSFPSSDDRTAERSRLLPSRRAAARRCAGSTPRAADSGRRAASSRGGSRGSGPRRPPSQSSAYFRNGNAVTSAAVSSSPKRKSRPASSSSKRRQRAAIRRSSSAIRARSGSGFSSSAAIRFGGRFQTWLNQSRKRPQLRAARGVGREERRLGEALLEVLEDRAASRRGRGRRRRGPARAPGR